MPKVLLVLLLTIHLVLTQQTFWKWKCVDNKWCVRTEPNENENSFYNSIEVCRLVCGNDGAVWPIPSLKFVKSNELIEINPRLISFDIIAKPNVRALLELNKEIFIDNLLSECKLDESTPTSMNIIVTIEVDSNELKHTWDTDESYFIKSNNSRWIIKANTFFGARHGLETLSQLTGCQWNMDKYELLMLKDVEINDRPRYAHRGLLIDTARNFLSVQSIKKQIDGMAASKMNILHWHATDTQGFSYVSKRVPYLAKYGAISKDKQYKADDVRDIKHYAKVRGVRVLLEIDAPAHAGNGWQWGPMENLGNLSVCTNQNPWRKYCIQPPCGQLNPANHKVYDVLEKLYQDIAEDFPDNDAFHMGGDEVFIPCWNLTDEVVDYLKGQGKGQSKTDFLDLWGEFQENALQKYDGAIGHSMSKAILWSSDLTDPSYIENYLDKNRYVIQTWVPSIDPLPHLLIERGYKLIISTKNAWYLDHGFWGITSYYTWRTAYNNKIIDNRNVLGGEVCMWGEYVDENAIDGRIWPRAAAAAERLWSNPNLSSAEVEARMQRHRHRLVSRGIEAEALAPLWCYHNEGQCQ